MDTRYFSAWNSRDKHKVCPPKTVVGLMGPTTAEIWSSSWLQGLLLGKAKTAVTVCGWEASRGVMSLHYELQIFAGKGLKELV